MEAIITAVIDRHGPVLSQGTVLVDPDDPSTEPKALVYVEHEIPRRPIRPPEAAGRVPQAPVRRDPTRPNSGRCRARPLPRLSPSLNPMSVPSSSRSSPNLGCL